MKKEQVFYALVASVMFLMGCSDSGFKAEDDADPVKVSVKDGVFTDERDGNKYRVQTFGSDVWLVDNLRYVDSSAALSLKGNVWCPDDEEANCKKYGPLYSWTAVRNISADYLKDTYGRPVMSVQGICPNGWRVPTNADWLYLRAVVQKQYPDVGVGDVVKSAEGWVDTAGVEQTFPDNMAFNAEPAGRRNKEGGFLQSGSFAFFWTAEENDKATAYGWALRNDNAVLDSGHFYKEHGMSLRCIASFPDKIEWSGNDEASRTRPVPYDTLEIDGLLYRTLKIAGIRWMVDNLNFETKKSRCYKDQEENCEKYGRLYLYDEIGTVCPEGWHLPNMNEWNTLLAEVGGDMYALSAKDVWEDGVGTDDLGISLLPGGTLDNGSFSDLGNAAYYWVGGQSLPTCLRYYSYSPKSQMATLETSSGASVRCVEDKK